MEVSNLFRLHENASFDELIPIGVDEPIPIGVDELIPIDVSDLFSRPRESLVQLVNTFNARLESRPKIAIFKVNHEDVLDSMYVKAQRK
jgi:hypothetical protein